MQWNPPAPVQGYCVRAMLDEYAHDIHISITRCDMQRSQVVIEVPRIYIPVLDDQGLCNHLQATNSRIMQRRSFRRWRPFRSFGSVQGISWVTYPDPDRKMWFPWIKQLHHSVFGEFRYVLEPSMLKPVAGRIFGEGIIF